jgi:hypothetical protein
MYLISDEISICTIATRYSLPNDPATPELILVWIANASKSSTNSCRPKLYVLNFNQRPKELVPVLNAVFAKRGGDVARSFGLVLSSTCYVMAQEVHEQNKMHCLL